MEIGSVGRCFLACFIRRSAKHREVGSWKNGTEMVRGEHKSLPVIIKSPFGAL